jgi:hypothetical protein
VLKSVKKTVSLWLNRGIMVLSHWLKRHSPIWFVLPYLVSSAASTAPTLAGYAAMGIEWIVFGIVFIGWRYGEADPNDADQN